MVHVVNNNNNIKVVSDSNSDKEIKNNKKNFFGKDIDDKVKMTPKMTINAKVFCAVRNLQSSYNNDAKKIIKLQRKKVLMKI